MAAGATVGIGDVGGGGIPGGGGSVSGGMEAELGSLLSSGFDNASGGEGATDTPPGESGSEPTQPTETVEELPAGEAPSGLDTQGRPQEQTPNTQPEAAEPLPGWKVSADGKSYTVPATDLPRVQSAIQFSDAVGQFFSTPQQAQGAYQDASATRQMFNDWMYGTDNAVKSVLQHWAGATQQDPGTRMAFQRSFSRMLQMAPDYLKNSAPDAYSLLVSSFGTRLVQNLYEKAARSGNPDDLMDAQSVEWGLTGKYQDKPPQLDPQAAKQAEFDQRVADFNARQEAGMRRDVNAFNQNTVEGAKLGQLDGMIAKQLESIKSRFPEVAFNDLVAGIHREVMDTLMKQGEWWTEHKQAFDKLINDYRLTWQNGSPGQGLQPHVQAYIQDFLARAQRLLPSIAQKRVNAATTARVNGAATGGKRQSAPASRPQAQPSQSAPNGARKETRSEQFDRELNSIFASVRG